MTLLLVFFVSFVGAQALDKNVGESYIARFQKDVKASEIAIKMSALGIQSPRALVPSIQIYQLNSVDSKSHKKLKADPQVIWIQKNHKLSLRRKPNDQHYRKQWGLKSQTAGLNAEAAWDLGVSGKTALGDETVVAVIDSGTDVSHRDISENIWVNKGEIPANGIDDDQNGYIDDINGWNFYDDNSDIPAALHGTHVAGIVGARGNNLTEVSGVNWRTKVMPLAGSSMTTSTVLSAYSYVLTQKRLWLESQGEKGANVVATNSSFGIDEANCESGEYPAWNDIYDEMGRHGILSAAATANRNVNVDRVGDVPTGCKSEFIVAVTNIDKRGRMHSDAAYGSRSIDLAAPGTDVISLFPGNATGDLTGTSMSTPHVAGAIAFLHSIGSSSFAQYAKDNPAEAARALKRQLITSVTRNSHLRNKTVSGGHLNLWRASQSLANFERSFWSQQIDYFRKTPLFDKVRSFVFSN